MVHILVLKKRIVCLNTFSDIMINEIGILTLPISTVHIVWSFLAFHEMPSLF